ncbi:hypothetical protein HYS47_00005 [Candidatus Woesearchaeota archaeon]|nr:hypothetical protein [Candidatus Woesearchaeota archaeon]
MQQTTIVRVRGPWIGTSEYCTQAKSVAGAIHDIVYVQRKDDAYLRWLVFGQRAPIHVQSPDDLPYFDHWFTTKIADAKSDEMEPISIEETLDGVRILYITQELPVSMNYL